MSEMAGRELSSSFLFFNFSPSHVLDADNILLYLQFAVIFLHAEDRVGQDLSRTAVILQHIQQLRTNHAAK